jgi:hypothetical protein
MKHLLFISIFLFLSENLCAQFTGHQNALNITGPQNILRSEIPLATPSVTGSTYLNDNFQNAEIVLKDGLVIQGFPLRVEIEQANVEIQYQGEIKFLNLKNVESINLIDGQTGVKSVIQKASKFTLNNVPLKGIVMVDNNGTRYKIIKHFYIEFLSSNYNVAMDVGSKDHRKIKREKLYIAQHSKLILVKGSVKKIAGQLGADKEKALNLIREHKLRLSKETDLIEFVRLLQS